MFGCGVYSIFNVFLWNTDIQFPIVYFGLPTLVLWTIPMIDFNKG